MDNKRSHWRWILLIAASVTLFYWKIVFTKQFSILWQWEPVTQSYSWYNFAAKSIQQGVLPLWDPYRFSGSTFIGEMQTGLFYPLKLLVYLMPLDSNGMVSERIYNQFYVLTHILGAVFMFLLARHLRLSNFASAVAGLAYSIQGYLGNTGHPHTLDSGIWLPLVVLFYLRSAEQTSTRRGVFYAALSGLSLGMMVLAGGIHMVIMSAIVIAAMVFLIGSTNSQRARLFAMAVVVAVFGFLFGAIQLLPSYEYGPFSYRWVGGDWPIKFDQKVPYQFLGGIARFSPRSLFTFLFGAASPGDHLPSNYFGVLPFFLAVIGAWNGWQQRWIKQVTILAVAAYLYGWGQFSFLHGVLYLVPGLDIAREAGRFILLTHFATALLAAYGIDVVFGDGAIAKGLLRTLRWLVVFLTALLIAGSVQHSIAIDDSFFMSFVFIAASYFLLEALSRGYRVTSLKFAVVFLLLWDAYEFNYPIQNKAQMLGEQHDYMEQLLASRKLADSLKFAGSRFRVHFEGEAPPNIGDSYGAPMTGGMAATMLVDYFGYLGHPQMPKLLNVRYTIRRMDGEWRAIENADAGPPAWVVHQVEIESSTERPPKRLNAPDFDPRRIALLEAQMAEPIDPSPAGELSSAELTHNDAASLEYRVKANGRGLLVASEVFYPGWRATVNGQPAPIYRVDGLLRGIPVPSGESVVRLEYKPLSVGIGLGLTLLALCATLVFALI